MNSTPLPPPSSADQPAWQQPPAQSSGAVRPPLRRSGTEKMLGGVCGGLAEYSGIDPLLWRVGFIALALSGVGLIVYLLLWVLMPPAPAAPENRVNAADRYVEKLHTALTGTGAGTARG